MSAREPTSFRHELYTHLTVVKGYAQLVARQLRRADIPRDRILTYAEALEREVADLEATTQALLQREQQRASPPGAQPRHPTHPPTADGADTVASPPDPPGATTQSDA